MIFFYFIGHFPARTAFIHYCKDQKQLLECSYEWRVWQPLLFFAEYEDLKYLAKQTAKTVSVSVAHSACVYFINLTSAR